MRDRLAVVAEDAELRRPPRHEIEQDVRSRASGSMHKLGRGHAIERATANRRKRQALPTQYRGRGTSSARPDLEE